MNRTPKLWEILISLMPIFIALTSWLWYLSTKVEKDSVRLDNVELIQKEEKIERKEDIKEIKNSMYRTEEKLDRLIESKQSKSNKNGRKTNQPSGQPEIQLDRKQDFQSIRQNSIFPTSKQQSQKIPTYKMTFNLTEDIYKAFNDLYANRMLQGRKTEKSEMICEAIQWLIKMEDEQRE